jgi:hypothetical protein
VQIVTPTGQVVGVFGQDENRGVLSILNRFGTPLFAVTEDADGRGSVVVLNKEGKIVGRFGTALDGDGYLSIYNKEGTRAGKLGSGTTGGTFHIYDQTSRLIGRFGARTSGGGSQIDVLDGDFGIVWSSQQSVSTGLIGDLDNDNDVDFADFLLFAQNFGKK